MLRHFVFGILAVSFVIAAATTAQAVTPEEEKEGFVSLFDGKTLEGWQGSVDGYSAEDGAIVCSKGGNLYTAKEYSDFVFRFEFIVPAGGNNGVGIRTPMGRDAAYAGMEIQVLDNSAERYANLKPYQYHGSIYGVVAAKRGFQKPVGEWNCEEIRCDGSKIKITLNGTVIVDADLAEIEKTADGRNHPGLHNAKGYIGFLGHGSPVRFRNIRILELNQDKE